MDALNLHHAIFSDEKISGLPLRSASSFLRPAPDRNESPTSHLFAYSAYQDIIQRQPTHPDGPLSGWDLGLNLLGDPVTTGEHRSIEDHETKVKLRRLRVVNIAFELLFSIWGTYTTFRYFLAFAVGSGDTEHTSLVLGVASAIVVILVIISISIPYFPRRSHPKVWRHTRLLIRACYLLLVSACAVVNLVLVLMWHPSDLCGWDIDISWYASVTNTPNSPCHSVPFATWAIAAVLRVVVTWVIALSFVYTLRVYHDTRHPTFERSRLKYLPYFSSDPEDISPVSTSSPHHPLKLPFTSTQSEDSDHRPDQSSTTLPKYKSISTLALSTPCTGHSRSLSAPPKDISPVKKVSPPTSRKTSIHMTNYGPSTQLRSETPTHTVTEPSSAPQILRRMTRISHAHATQDPTLFDTSSYPERSNNLMSSYGPSEIRSCSGPGHRGTDVHLDTTEKISLSWENSFVHNTSQADVSSSSLSPTHDSGESVKEKNRVDDDLVYSYGYGAQGRTYPYLDMYNPQRPGGYTETSSSLCEDVNEHGLLIGHRRTTSFPDVSSSEASSPTREEEEESGSGEEEEYVAMMGGFVRRMATIESLGSREGAGTVSTTTGTGSVVRRAATRSKTPGSQFSSVRFAGLGSSYTSTTPESTHSGSTSSPSSPWPLVAQGRRSPSTAYLSFSSGGTGKGMRVNERGELWRWPGSSTNGSSADSHSDRHYYTASSMDDEDEGQ